MVRFVLDDDKVYKVVAESEDAIWVIDYDNPCAPKMVKQDGLVNLEEIPVPDDYMQESVVSRAIYDTAKKRLNILSPMLSNSVYITNSAERQGVLTQIAQNTGISNKTLKRWYYSYLAYGERGLCPASKIKKSKTLPQEHEKKIASALSKYYYSPKKRSLKTTYEMMLLKYYRNEQRIIVPDHPTYGQFLYYYRKNRDVVRKLISREGIGEYQKNARPLLGKGDAGITTIGYFEIDATVADIYVVSRFDRKPIGRPVLYVAIDIASRMIAGIYVGFEESAEAVLTCLANAACDKVDFCKEHGISITADMWPSKGLPGTIYTDRGSDFASFRVKELCSTFNMEITTLPPYRPDLKGYVERAIGCIQERYKPLLRGKGVVDKTSLERSQPDYAQQAILDIEEYTKVVIECVLYYNASHVQKKYERSQVMIEQGVPPIASELWKFYNAQTKTNIIYADDELLQMLLLPRKKARITRYGVENDGIYYYSDELKMEFVRAGINGAKQVDIAFMPNDNSFIYLVDNGLYHMTQEEEQLIDTSLYRCYKDFGITNDNESILDKEHGGYKKMPLLEDLQKEMQNVPELHRICNILNPLITGSMACYNRPTNVDLKAKYIVFDFNGMKGAILTMSMFVVLDFVWTKIKEDRTKRKAVFIDECWKLIGTDSNEMAAEDVVEIFRTIRAYGGSAFAMTQDISQFYEYKGGKYGKAIIGNADTKIIMHLIPSEAQALQSAIQLTDAEMENVSNLQRGQGLVCAASAKLFVDFVAAPYEKQEITTDAKSFYLQEKALKEKQHKEEQERLAAENAKGGSDSNSDDEDLLNVTF